MKKALLVAGFIGVIFISSRGYCADPVVSNVRASQRAGTKLVDILYDVTADNALTISAAVSTNAGLTYDLPAGSFNGTGYGAGVAPGTNKAIVWDAGADWPGQFSSQVRVKVMADDGSQPVIPPDPASVATPPSNGVVTLLRDATAFLYSGANPIQTGVSTGAISLTRAAVLRGRLKDTNGAPLAGSTVSINGHPEFGQTISRANGGYDMAVNGGTDLQINYHKNGYLPAQRTIAVPWQDYVAVDDVVLKVTDATAAVMGLNTNVAQTALGNMLSDSSGARRAMVMVPGGVTASVLTYGGETQAIGSLTTKLTEYTVGENGLAAMPGDLPPSVAYTYCVELTAEEAQAKVAGRDVLFNTNVYFYVDNFLGMPAGIQVPMAYYDKDRGAWVPSQDGWVIQLIGTNAAGLARISLNTNGTEASASELAALGFTDAERLKLAQTYGVCTNSLWRTPIMHYSTYDLNYGVAAAAGAQRPTLPSVDSQGNVNDPNGEGGMGEVVMENQVFRESCPIAGTPLRLCYSSERMPGYLAALDIPLTSGSIPSSLRAIEVQVTIAGMTTSNRVTNPTINQTYEIIWNGYDAYGRLVRGEQPVIYRVGYVYPAYYALPPIWYERSFGYVMGERVPGNIPARRDITLWSEGRTTIGYSPSGLDKGLGGWTLNVHHSYDPTARMLEMGDGRRIRATQLRHSRFVINPFAGDGYTNSFGQGRFYGDGGPATTASFWTPLDVAAGPDGSVYVADLNNYRVRKIGTNGIITTVAGDGTMGYAGDGGPATNTGMYPNDVAVGNDGAFYISDRMNYRVYKIGTNGIITTVAGTGVSGFSGDGGPATNAQLNWPADVAIGADGTVYISDWNNHRIRRVAPDGIIMTFAGNGTEGCSGDGSAATNAQIAPAGLAIGPDGSVTFANPYLLATNGFRRVDTDGIIRAVAGGGSGNPAAGLPATNVYLYSPSDVAFDAQGTMYLSDFIRRQVYMVGADGILKIIAGNGAAVWSGDYGPAPAAGLDRVDSVAVAPDGAVYVCSEDTQRIRVLQIGFPGVQESDILIPDEAGRLIYQFNAAGRHLRTYDALTCSNVYSFSYDTNGYLSMVSDGDGNVTAIERNAGGNPTAIVGPYGHRTTLAVNGDGYLTSVQNPAGETTTYGYTTNALLTSVQGAKGPDYTYTLSYTAAGRVIRASDPAGGYTALGRETLSNGYQVASTSAMGAVTRVRVENLASGDQRRLRTRPDGAQELATAFITGLQSNRMPEGKITLATLGPDPRFSMQMPMLTQQIVRLASGLAMTNAAQKTAATTGSTLGLLAITNRTIVNGRTNVAVYSVAGRQILKTSFANRQTRKRLDAMGRVTALEITGLETITNTYDNRGRLAATARGSGGAARAETRQYNSAGELESITDAIGREHAFIYDAVGRLITNTMPGNRIVSYRYDAHGNRTSIAPPTRPAHTFAYTLVDLPAEYTPPAVDGATNTTYYTYNADRQPTSIRRPGGMTISNVYNAAGQLRAVSLPGGGYTNAWQTNGLLGASMASSGVTITNTYDGALVTATRWLGTVTGQVSRTYDNDFRVVALNVNGANPVAYQYDADSLLTQAGVCSFSRNAANGLLTGRNLSNIVETLSYNTFGEVTNITVACNGTNLFVVNYAFDKLGRLTNLAEVIQSTTSSFVYAYDPAGRLSQVITNGTGTNIYQYDSNGNRTNWNVAGIAATASNDVQDRFPSSASSLQTNVYAYNAAGDLTNKTVNGSNTVYQYDALGNLLNVTLPIGRTNEYLLDGWNRRVGKKVNGVFTNGFLYAGQLLPVAELDGNFNAVSVFIFGTRDNVPDYMIRGGVTYRIIADHLGSPRLVVQAETGAVVQRMDYDEFGRVVRDTNPGFQPFGFAGGLYDPDTGLLRFGARDYDPEIGRWTAKDPALFSTGSMNLYAYVNNNPVNSRDNYGFGPLFQYPDQGPPPRSFPAVFAEEAWNAVRPRDFDRPTPSSVIGVDGDVPIGSARGSRAYPESRFEQKGIFQVPVQQPASGNFIQVFIDEAWKAIKPRQSSPQTIRFEEVGSEG